MKSSADQSSGDLSEQIFETVAFLTTKKIKDRNPIYSGIKIHLKTIAPDKLFGLKSVWMESTKIQVSDPSRTIIDLLDDPSLGGGITPVFDFMETYLESKHKDLNLLVEYAERMKNGAIFKRLGFILELSKVKDPVLIKKIQSKISKGYSRLDPNLDCKRIIKKWNLKLSESWMREYDRKK